MKGSLAELLMGGAGDEEEHECETLTPEERVNRLKSAFDAYTTKHDFAPGDIVIGKKACPAPIKDADKPHIVMEVGCTGFAPRKDSQNGEGDARSLRVGCFYAGTFNTYLVNPAYFEPYAG